MHKFNLYEEHKHYFTPEIIALVTKIYQYKGRQDLFIETRENEIECFKSSARKMSTVSSNRISGITTADSRIDDLIDGQRDPKNINEEEITCLLYTSTLPTILLV